MEVIKLRHELEDLKDTIANMRNGIEKAEIKLVLIERELLESPEQEFKKKFPKSKVDKQLFRLVGTQPSTNLEDEKKAIKEAVAERFGS